MPATPSARSTRRSPSAACASPTRAARVVERGAERLDVGERVGAGERVEPRGDGLRRSGPGRGVDDGDHGSMIIPAVSDDARSRTMDLCAGCWTTQAIHVATRAGAASAVLTATRCHSAGISTVPLPCPGHRLRRNPRPDQRRPQRRAPPHRPHGVRPALLLRVRRWTPRRAMEEVVPTLMSLGHPTFPPADFAHTCPLAGTP